MTSPWIYQAADEDATRRLGIAMAAALPNGTVVGLIGPLGAGKTRLVQAIAAGTGIDSADVVSPTYVVIHEHEGARPIFHFDLYRVRDEDEFLELGADEYFEQSGLSLVEWPDRFDRCLPEERIDVTIVITGTTSRDFHFRAAGPQLEAVVARIAEAVATG